MNKLEKLNDYINLIQDDDIITLEDMAVSFIAMRKGNLRCYNNLGYDENNNILTIYPEYYPSENIILLYALLFVAKRSYNKIRIRNPEFNMDGYDEYCISTHKYLYGDLDVHDKDYKSSYLYLMCNKKEPNELEEFYNHYILHGGDPEDKIIKSMFSTLCCVTPILNHIEFGDEVNIDNYNIEDMVKMYKSGKTVTPNLKYEEKMVNDGYVLKLNNEYIESIDSLIIYALLFIAKNKYDEIIMISRNSEICVDIHEYDDTINEFAMYTIKYDLINDEKIQNAYKSLKIV